MAEISSGPKEEKIQSSGKKKKKKKKEGYFNTVQKKEKYIYTYIHTHTP